MPDKPLMDTATDGPFAEVLAEILPAEEQGQAPDLERLVADFPELESRLRAYFRNREGFERLAVQLAPTPHNRGAGDSITPRPTASVYAVAATGSTTAGNTAATDEPPMTLNATTSIIDPSVPVPLTDGPATP
jgi:hypothetical protein